MKKILGWLLLVYSPSVWAQHDLTAKVTAADSHQPLAGTTVSLQPGKKTTTTNSHGIATFKNLPSGTYQLLLTYVGYRDTAFSVMLPLSDTLNIELSPSIKSEEQIIVTSTRINSRIADLPVRVEVLAGEELEEEAGIKPGNISSLLGDLSAIHIQNTSSVTGSSILRLQGLDGRYTQLLRDGFPVYEGLNTNFGILAIPPLDLKQVEIIKGSVSTLYGGGAIAGLINFISKTPKQAPELTLLLNRSTLKETNGNAFYAQRWNKMGLTLFAGTTLQEAVDVNKDGFSDVPRVRQFNLHPRLFFYLGERQTLTVGYNGTTEDRKGGDLYVVEHGKNGLHQFVETNKSFRNSVDVQYGQKLSDEGDFVLKSSAAAFHLENAEPGFALQGRQVNTYTEASYHHKRGKADLVTGANYLTEGFTPKRADTSQFGAYQYHTLGAFAQADLHLAPELMTEAGLRTDHHSSFGWFVLPRIALVYKPISPLSLRLSAGLGYKIPNVFTLQSEQVQLKEMNASVAGLQAERSRGVNFDVNYHTRVGEWELTLNQAFYYTGIEHPVSPVGQANGRYSLQNMPFRTQSTGTDTYVRLLWEEVELYLGYNHTVARYSNDTKVLYAPQDKFGATVAYEIEGKWRMGLESAWVGNQYIDNHTKAPDYWFWAAMIQRNLGEHFSVVLNGENLLDRRQGKHSPLYTGSISNPEFVPIWGPIEGRVLNLSLKWTM